MPGMLRVLREHPAEDAESGASAPAVVGAVASSGPGGFGDLVAEREEQVAAKHDGDDSLQDSTSLSCSTVGAPSRPLGVG